MPVVVIVGDSLVQRVYSSCLINSFAKFRLALAWMSLGILGVGVIMLCLRSIRTPCACLIRSSFCHAHLLNKQPYQERFTTGGRVGGPRNFGAGGGGGAQAHRAPMYGGGYGGRGSGRGGVMYPRPTGGRGFVGGPGMPVAGVPGVAAVPGVPGVPAGGFGGPYMAGGAAG